MFVYIKDRKFELLQSQSYLEMMFFILSKYKEMVLNAFLAKWYDLHRFA